MIKPVSDVTACVCDYGTFLSVAEKLAETMKKVYYWNPIETEYQDIRNYSIGYGLENVQKLDELYDPSAFDKIDLFVFPDIAFGSLQNHLRDLGKQVWGHLGATELELHRDLFLRVLEGVGLPTPTWKTIVGVSDLRKYLKDAEGTKHIKINRFRGNVETFKHHDYEQSERTLDSLGVIFGGTRETVVFVVQDDIETDYEVGYDGWCIDGKYPPFTYQGYEKKNELYLGSVLADADLPDEIKTINEAMGPVLASYGYRGWWATEIRVGKDGEPYFIDPTPRMPGQTGEHQLESMANFSEVIWKGANGTVVAPDFTWEYAAEATLHYDSKTKDPTISDEWKTLRIPKEVERWVKLYGYCKIDDQYHFGARNTDEVGVVIGVGDSTAEAIQDTAKHLHDLKRLPVHAEIEEFGDLLKSIREAEKHGIKFGDKPIPKPEEITKLIEE